MNGNSPIVGEAVKRLTFNFRAANPGIDWRRWAGLRDVLVHAYDVVDTAQVWEIARDDVAELLAFLSTLTFD
ncbi:MAG: HepT-like ribonuclease domain-containing protein [bacterium]